MERCRLATSSSDEVVLTEEDWQGRQSELDGLDPHWVRVQIDLDVLDERERARPEARLPGHPRSQHAVVHRHPTYDAEVDTGVLDPDAAAAAVIADWRARAQ